MKTYIRRREKNNQLVVIFGDWGTDENIFIPLCNDKFDFILFYNYSSSEPMLLPEMKIYEKITLIGWSLGVWAAEFISPKTGIKPDVTIAVNGTPRPADNQYGIPLDVFEGTLNNITRENIGEFYLRIFGDKKTYEANIDKVPRRSLNSLNKELRWLYNRIMEQKDPGFRWDFAVSSANDLLFPSKNLAGFWGGKTNTKHIILPFPHYFFNKWKSFTDFISFVENYKTPGPRQKKEPVRKTTNL
jgi:pimeloyl-[acyl-carrier protein] methyl ester esterase